MRLKAVPEDFRVREELSFPRVDGGQYDVHLLRKQKLDTQSALARLAQLARIPREDIAFAGLKDRQGVTEQWISVKGKRIDHRESGLQVMFRGRSDRPINSKMSRGNAFEIVLRELSGDDVVHLRQSTAQVVEEGLPNYFDDQRFGCLVHGQGFVLPAVWRGEFETALHQLVAQPSPRALTGDVKLKRLLERHWGDWFACAGIARGPFYGRLFRHLEARPHDFEGALRVVPTRTKLIHAYAYQSWLWNRTVDGMLHRLLPRRRVTLTTRSGQLCAWDRAPAALVRRIEGLKAPLFAPDGSGGDAEYEAALLAVLDRQGFARRFEPPRVAGMQLREEPRCVVVRPRDLRLSDAERDEMAPGLRRATISFALPRGSYATLVIKRLMARSDRRPEPQTGARHA